MLKSVRRRSQRFKARAVAALVLCAALSMPCAMAQDKQKGQVAQKPQPATLAPPMSAKIDQRAGAVQAATPAKPATVTTTNQKTTTVKQTTDVKTPAAQAPDAAKAAVAKPGDDGKKPVEDKKATGSTKSTDNKVVTTKTTTTKKTSTKKVVAKKSRSSSMIPPPPPEMPTIMPTTDPQLLSISGLPLEYLTGEALRERQKDLKSQLKEIRDDLAMRERNCTDKIQRAEQFESLYQEGVVSRRELETAQMEAKDCEQTMSRVKLKISELDTLLKKVDERVAKQPGNKATPKASEKKKRSK